MAGRLSIFLFGLAAYLVFAVTVLYGIGFIGNFVVPKAVGDGVPSAPAVAVAVDVALLALFGLQHSVMARPAFKAWWLRLVPEPLERSVYVLLSSACLALLFWQWRPLPGVVWDVASGPMHLVLRGLFWAGWLIVAASSFSIDHFDLFGLRQVTLCLRGQPYTPTPFKQPAVYRLVRHPLMLGFLVGFWATPRMSAGHLLFAAGMTAYILIGIRFEERDLLRVHGERYARYRDRVAMLIPLPWRK